MKHHIQYTLAQRRAVQLCQEQELSGNIRVTFNVFDKHTLNPQQSEGRVKL
jgi:hypothetical protein